MTPRVSDDVAAGADGRFLAAAALLFWVAWLLMPGVGVTDPAQIFALVGNARPLVAASVVVQLLSAALYAPALVGFVSRERLGRVRGARAAAGLLLVGAMGSAADAVLHLLAYAMTGARYDADTLVGVMAFMQGPGLLLLAPLLVCFFAGGIGLSLVLRRAALVPRANPHLYTAALATAVVGGTLAAAGLVPARAVGLAALGLVAAAQAWAGLAVTRNDGAGAMRWSLASPD